MKKFVAILLLTAVTISALADRYVARHEDIKAFLKTTTYVVLEDNATSAYNVKIREAVEKSWKITPYEFIAAKQFEQVRKDIDKSFLVLIQLKFDKDKVEVPYNFLSLVLGSSVKKIADMPDICSIPLSYANLSEDFYEYKVEGLVRFIQLHVSYLDKNPQFIKGKTFKHYNKNVMGVKAKELWLLENDVEKSTRSLANIRKNYPYTVKFVNADDIEKAIAEKNPNVVYLHKVGAEGGRLQARCYKMVIGAADDQLYYYDYHIIGKSAGDGLLVKDLKKLGKK